MSKLKKIKLIRIANVPGALSHILKGQLEYINYNTEFEVIGVSLPGEKLENLGIQEKIRIYGLKMNRGISPIEDIIAIWKLFKFLRIEKPFIIHSHTPKAGFISMIASFFAKIPIRIHTFTGLIFPSKNGLMKFILINMDRVICIFATHIYPEGNGVKNDLIKYRITKKNLKVLVNGNINGIDCDYYNNCKFSELEINTLKKTYNITNSDLIFIYVGRILKDKGINELVNAFLQIFQNIKNIKLLIVGEFEDQINPVKKHVKNEILNNPNIIYAGFQEDVRPFYCISDVLVLPSYREGFPNVVLQAGAMNLPCIVSDINGCNEIIINDINGLLVKPKDVNSLVDKIQLLINDPILRNKLSNNSREMIITRFTQKDIWDATIFEYRNALKKYNL